MKSRAERRPTRRWAGALFLVTLVAIVALVPAWSAAASRQSQGDDSPPTIEVSNPRPRVGEQIQIIGDQWEPNKNVKIEFCGNEAVDGSVDCEQRGSITQRVYGNSKFDLTMTVPEPPTPCPCVVLVTELDGPFVAKAPIEIQGVPTAPVESVAPLEDPEVTLTVVAAEVTTDGSVAAWFGASTDQTLRLVVRNDGTQPVQDPLLTLAWGRGDSADNIVPAVALDPIPPGEDRIIEVPYSLDPFSFGNYTVRGEVGEVGNRAPFEASTSHWPWGLLVIFLGFVQLVLLKVRNVMRRRKAEAEARGMDEAGDMDEAGSTTGPAAAETTDIDAPDEEAGAPPAAEAEVEVDG